MKLALQKSLYFSLIFAMQILALPESNNNAENITLIANKASYAQINQAFEQAAIIINNQLQDYHYLPEHTISSLENFVMYEEQLHAYWSQFQKNPNSITSLDQIILNPHTCVTLNTLLPQWQTALKNKWTFSSVLTHGLSAAAITTCAKYGINALKNSSNFIAPLMPLQETPSLKLDTSFKTYFINHWIEPIVEQYNKKTTTTMNCINDNIASTNQTIANINDNIKIAGIATIAVATVAALYGTYKHYQQVTAQKPIKRILFKMYTLLTNQPNDPTITNKMLAYVLELQKTLSNKLYDSLRQDLWLLTKNTIPAEQKISIIQRILDQYQF